MKFQCIFDMNSEAFEEKPATEAIRILEDIIPHVSIGDDDGSITDINGLPIGHWNVLPIGHWNVTE